MTSFSENKAAIYCRISSEDIDKSNKCDDSESIQNQKLLLVDYAVKQGWSIYDIYQDEDFSGFSDRPSFKRMIKDAEKGRFNVILCKHQSRFTRDIALVEQYIHGLFVEWGIRFVSITDNVDTNIKGNKKARQINSLINEWYSEDLSENIKLIFRRKMESGQFIGSFACFGYDKNPLDKHKLVVDEEAAAIVREIFSLYIDGLGISGIAKLLTKRNTPTPTEYKKSKGLKFANPNAIKGSVWAANTIRRILRNESYIGSLIQGRERKLSYKSKKIIATPKDEWIVIKNNHDPIIDEHTFNAVQKLLDSKRKSPITEC